jgi:hypothetical protein
MTARGLFSSVQFKMGQDPFIDLDRGKSLRIGKGTGKGVRFGVKRHHLHE